MDEEHAKNLVRELSNGFQSTLQPIPYAFFFAENDDQNYYCLASELNQFRPFETFSIYKIPGLIRTLTQKSNILSEQCQIAQEGQFPQHLCLILKWQQNDKRVLILEIKDNEKLNTESLETFLLDKKQMIQGLVETIFHKYEQ